MAPISRHGLFVTDLDGTLLRTDGTVSEYSLRVINQLVAGGVRFTFATSRSPDKACSLVRGLHLRLPAICLNGAVTIDPVTGRRFNIHALEASLVERILVSTSGFVTQPFLLGVEGARDALMHVTAQNPVQQAFLEKRAGEDRLRLVCALKPLQETLSVTFVDYLQRLWPVQERLASEYASELDMRLMSDLYFPGGGALEISRRGVDKVARVAELACSLGIEARDVTVFGDHINDLPMFAFAGRSVAVANAQPEVLAAAERHCESNDLDGVARFLESNLITV